MVRSSEPGTLGPSHPAAPSHPRSLRYPRAPHRRAFPPPLLAPPPPSHCPPLAPSHPRTLERLSNRSTSASAGTLSIAPGFVQLGAAAAFPHLSSISGRSPRNSA